MPSTAEPAADICPGDEPQALTPTGSIEPVADPSIVPQTAPQQPTVVASAAPPSSRAAGLPGRALATCKAALSKLTGSLASLSHTRPHRRWQRQQAGTALAQP